MLIKEYKATFLQMLVPLYDEMEAESFFHIILEFIHQKKRLDLALNPEMTMTEEQFSRWQSIVADLKIEKPIQYILGQTEFYGLPFKVNEHTLIPRPETEELVDLIVNKYSDKAVVDSELKILDIGTGSGCIAISLAKNLPNAKVFAIDVSDKALETARQNAEINQVEVGFILKNILETDDLGEQYSVIVSNPPYVRNLEKAEIKANVLAFEPHLALFVDDEDALLFYRKISQLAKQNLTQNGMLFFEINQYLGKETVALLQNLGFHSVQLLQDIYGNDRMISCVI